MNCAIIQGMRTGSTPLAAAAFMTGEEGALSLPGAFNPAQLDWQNAPADPVGTLLTQAASSGAAGVAARQRGDESGADTHFREAFDVAKRAAKLAADEGREAGRGNALRVAATFALEHGNAAEARRLASEAAAGGVALHDSEEWRRIRDVDAWPDAWLVACVRQDPPDEAALDELVARHWKPLFGRCQLLTINPEKAADLAQDVWRRVLRNRRALKPGGNFRAYLNTIATNLWRDFYRSARRAGPLAEHRLESLDAAHANDDGDGLALVDGIPDLRALSPDGEALLAMDIDRALAQLKPQLREVLIARVIAGESCAEIGRRHGRTEQCVSGWVRQALREMRRHLEEAGTLAEA